MQDARLMIQDVSRFWIGVLDCRSRLRLLRNDRVYVVFGRINAIFVISKIFIDMRLGFVKVFG